jgi:hypothetical protein
LAAAAGYAWPLRELRVDAVSGVSVLFHFKTVGMLAVSMQGTLELRLLLCTGFTPLQ